MEVKNNNNKMCTSSHTHAHEPHRCARIYVGSEIPSLSLSLSLSLPSTSSLTFPTFSLEWNVFERIWTNWIFLGILIFTVTLQAILVEFGGTAVSTTGTAPSFSFCLSFWFLSLSLSLSLSVSLLSRYFISHCFYF